jgi:hypothetical protein
MRTRCRAIAADHLNWETEATTLVDVYRGLAPRAMHAEQSAAGASSGPVSLA